MGYETVDTASTFINWGRLGQQVQLEVLSFDPTGGTNYNNEPCPRVVGRLLADCDNYRDLRGTAERVTLRAGAQVTVDGGTANLRKGLLIAAPERGHHLQLTYSDQYETTQGKGKVITVAIDRDPPRGDDPVGEDDI